MPQIGQVERGQIIGKDKGSRYIWDSCSGCGFERWLRLHGNGSMFNKSRLCRRCNAHTTRAFGPQIKTWNGGRRRTGNGYVRILVRSSEFYYPMAPADGYVLEHRLVMAQFFKRCLLPWEIVHHKNGVKDDNKLDNLELLPHGKWHIVDMAVKSHILRLEKKVKYLQNRLSEAGIGY